MLFRSETHKVEHSLSERTIHTEPMNDQTRVPLDQIKTANLSVASYPTPERSQFVFALAIATEGGREGDGDGEGERERLTVYTLHRTARLASALSEPPREAWILRLKSLSRLYQIS